MSIGIMASSERELRCFWSKLAVKNHLIIKELPAYSAFLFPYKADFGAGLAVAIEYYLRA